MPLMPSWFASNSCPCTKVEFRVGNGETGKLADHSQSWQTLFCSKPIHRPASHRHSFNFGPGPHTADKSFTVVDDTLLRYDSLLGRPISITCNGKSNEQRRLSNTNSFRLFPPQLANSPLFPGRQCEYELRKVGMQLDLLVQPVASCEKHVPRSICCKEKQTNGRNKTQQCFVGIAANTLSFTKVCRCWKFTNAVISRRKCNWQYIIDKRVNSQAAAAKC